MWAVTFVLFGFASRQVSDRVATIPVSMVASSLSALISTGILLLFAIVVGAIQSRPLPAATIASTGSSHPCCVSRKSPCSSQASAERRIRIDTDQEDSPHVWRGTRAPAPQRGPRVHHSCVLSAAISTPRFSSGSGCPQWPSLSRTGITPLVGPAARMDARRQRLARMHLGAFLRHPSTQSSCPCLFNQETKSAGRLLFTHVADQKPTPEVLGADVKTPSS